MTALETSLAALLARRGLDYFTEFDTHQTALTDALVAVGAGLVSTSTTSATIGTGSKSLTVATDKNFAAGQYVEARQTSAPGNFMAGVVTAYNGDTGVLAFTVASGDTGGGGTITNWTVTVAGRRGATGSAGSMTGPGSSTDNVWPRFNGAGGSTLQNGSWAEDDSGDVTAGGDLDMNGNSVNNATNLIQQGLHTIAMPAAGMTPRTTNGAVPVTEELPTNDVMVAFLAFDPAVVEAAQFAVLMPPSWNAATFTAKFTWKHPSTTTNFGVVWGVRARATSNGEALDGAWGTGVTVTDTGGTTGAEYTTDVTAAVTIGNTPAKGDRVVFEVYRNAVAGGDNLAVDAHLTDVHIYYTVDAATDA